MICSFLGVCDFPAAWLIYRLHWTNKRLTSSGKYAWERGTFWIMTSMHEDMRESESSNSDGGTGYSPTYQKLKHVWAFSRSVEIRGTLSESRGHWVVHGNKCSEKHKLKINNRGIMGSYLRGKWEHRIDVWTRTGFVELFGVLLELKKTEKEEGWAALLVGFIHECMNASSVRARKKKCVGYEVLVTH